MDSMIRGVVRRIKKVSSFLSVITLISEDEVWDRATIRIYKGIPRLVRTDLSGKIVEITTELRPPKNSEDIEMIVQQISGAGKSYLVKVPYSAVKKINQEYDAR